MTAIQAFHFDDSETLADELAALVVAGTKRATVMWQSGCCINLASYSNCAALPAAAESRGVANDRLFEIRRRHRDRS